MGEVEPGEGRVEHDNQATFCQPPLSVALGISAASEVHLPGCPHARQQISPDLPGRQHLLPLSRLQKATGKTCSASMFSI